jgi:hypothetical protein
MLIDELINGCKECAALLLGPALQILDELSYRRLFFRVRLSTMAVSFSTGIKALLRVYRALQ